MNIFNLISESGAIGWLIAFLTLLILAEIIFGLIIRTTKREYNTSLVNYTFAYKLLAWFLALSGFALIGGILLVIKEILLVGGIAGLIIGYFAINYLLAKKFGKHESKEEYDKRKAEQAKREEARVAELTKFRIGDKVKLKLKERIDFEYNSDGEKVFKSNDGDKEIRWDNDEMNKYRGKVLTVDYIDSDGDIAIKEDGHNNWYSDAILQKVRGREKVNKRKKNKRSNKKKR